MSPYPAPTSHARPSKGKARAEPTVYAREDPSGGEGGAVLPMELVGGTVYDAIYTIPILVGPNKQNLSVQVDTGSSDLWLTSTSCSQSSCSSTNRKYDSSQSTSTGQQFTITYVEGEVSGPIVWDTVQIGDYIIEKQALAAATHVDDEPLSSDFSGILGLALPLDSFISEKIPPVVGNSPDGAVFPSNLFGMTPTNVAPSSRFISLSLERPGSTKVPSLMGIGKHPPELVSDPSKILYASIVAEASGSYYWKVNVNAITVYQDGAVKPITLESGDGSPATTAVIDSGMPIILASLDIANGIYGAMGIGPASDGQYYVPCDLPINMTVTLDGRPEIPLHPLDLSTTSSSSTSSSATCVGLIQSFPAGSSVGSLADIVLGVPFMRSTYTVMAYDPPDVQGLFPNVSSSPSSSAFIRPRLGLLSLTDPTTALQEFNTVRVLNQPLDKGAQSNPSTVQTPSHGKKISVGIAVLIGLVGFFALCVVLFGSRWAYMRRRYNKSGGQTGSNTDSKTDDVMLQEVAYRLARHSSRTDPYGPSEETLRRHRFEEYKRRTGSSFEGTEKTQVGLDDGKKGLDASTDYQELGYRQSKFVDVATYSPDTEVFDDYALLPPNQRDSAEVDVDADYDATPSHPGARSTHDYTGQHERTPSGGPGVAVPLLAHTRSESQVSRLDDQAPRTSSSLRGPRHPRLSKAYSDTGRFSSMSMSSRQDSAVFVETSDITSPRHSRPSSPSPLPPPRVLTAVASEVSLAGISPNASNGHGS